MKEDLHNNSENHFRKTLSSDDYSTDSWDNPSGNVWEGIQATLPQTPQRRFGTWWILLTAAFLLSGVAGFWYLATPDPIKKTNEQIAPIAASKHSTTSTMRSEYKEPETKKSGNEADLSKGDIRLKDPTKSTQNNIAENTTQRTNKVIYRNDSPRPQDLQWNQNRTTYHKTVYNEYHEAGNFQLPINSKPVVLPTQTQFSDQRVEHSTLQLDIPNQHTNSKIPPIVIQHTQSSVKEQVPNSKTLNNQAVQKPTERKLGQKTVDLLKTKQMTATPLIEHQLDPGGQQGSFIHQLLDPVPTIRPTGNWYLGARYGPSLKGFLLSGKDKENFYKQQKSTYSGTSRILVGHRFNKRLQIEGGVGYSVSNYNFQKKSLFKYDKSKEKPDNNHYESDYKINVETGNGNIDVSAILSRHQQDLITDGQEFYLVTDVKERLNVLQIPLHLRYNLVTGKFMWYAKAGITANLLTGYSGIAFVEVFDSGGLTVKESTIKQQPELKQWKSLPLDINLASGVEYQLSDRLSLLLEPGLSAGLNAGYKTKNLKSIPISANFSLGLNYFF